ncbi:MAG TPA: di-heme oxidoredictase family protein [Candidatus Dormibacteraeota bacterium]|nr:di-heme oxidoredictase family protein [Candidatus Dormibacteraeota bacterium]
MKSRRLAIFALCLLALVCMLAVPSRMMKKVEAVCPTCPPPPPPPPTVGQFGGPLAGLTTGITNLFNGGYGTFVIKWDPVRGLGPVSTKTGCFNCHGAGVDVLTGTAGDTSSATGVRYGKWNSDGTFNYLDGTGTFPENEGGPIVHGVSNAAFGTLPSCNVMSIAKTNGATESGTTVTITTTAAHGFGPGQNAQILGVPVSGYNGTFSIVSVPTTTSFTFTAPTSGLAPSGGGTAQNLPHEVLPTDATVVTNIRSPQLFGLGLVDNIPDSAILANVAISKPFGITGIANMVPDENGVIRPGKFGQKLNIVSLFQFTANAEFNELGITTSAGPFGVASQFNPTEHLPQGQPFPKACQTDPNSPQDVSQSNMIKMTQFESLLAPIPPQPPNSQIIAGEQVFNNLGCSVCHIQNFTTQQNVKLRTTTGGQTAVIPSLSNVTFSPYSDFLLHDMGSAESGGLPFQPNLTGQATLTMWRTAPLWGLNNTLAKSSGLMHDNLSVSIDAAIRRHGGEAATVISNYEGLNTTDALNLKAFLGSL